MTSVASCGHNLNYGEGEELLLMDFFFDRESGKTHRAVRTGLYCDSCVKKYMGFGMILRTEKEKELWLSGAIQQPEFWEDRTTKITKILEEEDSSYCKLCSSCGESGCCSPLKCFSKLIKNDKCQNGEGYLKDIQIALEFSDWILGYFNNKDNLTGKDANRKYSEMMDRIYFEKDRDK